MHPRRHALMLMLAGLTAGRARAAQAAASAASDVADAGDDDGAVVQAGRALHFPRDHGAHRRSRIEWWYATGWLGTPAAPTHGFQATFFRSATGLAAHVQSRFAARHLLLAHAAVTVLGETSGSGGSSGSSGSGRHLHEQRIARWSGDPAAATAGAQLQDAGLTLGNWTLRRQGALWLARLPARSFSLDLQLAPTQPLLLQGQQGFSRKGPDAHQASHYYSEPQLAAQVQLTLQDAGRAAAAPDARGLAWLDHEWSNELLHPDAVGWDWVGMNLFDGGALTAFVLRRADGSVLWAGGSHRPAGGAVQVFGPTDVQWQPLRHWASPASAARYPVHLRLGCPAGRFEIRALLDAQELAGNGAGGAGGAAGAGAGAVNIYWEGLSELTAPGGQRLGLGYLEMTGYAARLRLG